MAAPVNEESPMPFWDCQVQGLDDKSQAVPLGSAPLTVGQKFFLHCEGASVLLEQEKVSLQMDKKEQYVLRLLETKDLNDHGASFIATSYLVGKNQPQSLFLTDGKSRVALHGLRYELRSVIDQKENPQRQPYGPIAPFALAWPMWFWFSLIFILLFIGTILFFRLRKRAQRKKLLQELARHGTAVSPYNQFNKDLRRLARQFPMKTEQKWETQTVANYLTEINQSFRWYLARELVVPALQWGPRQILRDIRRMDKHLYKNVRRDLPIALNELRQALQSKDKATQEDCLQLTELCRKVVETIFRARSQSPKGAI